MKKITAFILAMLMLLLLASCDDASIDASDAEEKKQGVIVDSKDGETENDGIKSDADDNVDYQITHVCAGYSEGLMFVDTTQLTMENHTISCIDKKGKIIFEIEASYVISGFYNGFALVMQEKAVLCDKTGKVITAGELGADSFIYDRTEIFEDGYILAKRVTTTFQGSVDEMAVFNSKLEKTVDFSKELYDQYINHFSYNGTMYYDGYLFGVVESYLDLRTGTLYDDISELSSKLNCENNSDLWLAAGRYNGTFSVANDEEYFIYDYRDRLSSDEYHPTITPVIDLSEYAETATVCSMNKLGDRGYVDGTAALQFVVQDSERGVINYFTIMDESGSFCFEPIETKGTINNVKNENGIYVLQTYYYTSNGEIAENIEVYDRSGFIGSLKCDHSLVDFDIGDGVIHVEMGYFDNAYKSYANIFTTELKPLF